MTIPVEIAQKISANIDSWFQDGKKMIVGIDGYSGSGKTTVLDTLACLDKRILAVHVDDFIKHWTERKKMMDDAKDKSEVFELQWYRYNELEELLSRFKQERTGFYSVQTYDFDKNDFGPAQNFDLSKEILVLEGIFLFHPKHKISQMFDRRVYIDVDFLIGDERRVNREKKKWGKKYVSEDHPDSYVNAYRIAYLKYIEKYRPEKTADIAIKA